jgi:hypothetical protein
MSRPPEGWHVGRARSDIYESCTGILETGYWYAGGPEKEPYSYFFLGLVWRGKWTFGVGRYTHDNNKEET